MLLLLLPHHLRLQGRPSDPVGFPGWQVRVDDRMTNWNSTTGMLDFIVPAGTHQVEIRYTAPAGATTGRAVSLLTITGLLVWWWLNRRRDTAI